MYIIYFSNIHNIQTSSDRYLDQQVTLISDKTILIIVPSNTWHASSILLTFPYIPTNSFTTIISHFNIRQFQHFHKSMHSSAGFFHKWFKWSKTNKKRKKSKEFQLERRLLHEKNRHPTKNNTRITNSHHYHQHHKRSLSWRLLGYVGMNSMKEEEEREAWGML